jgi:hypothetical protein
MALARKVMVSAKHNPKSPPNNSRVGDRKASINKKK